MIRALSIAMLVACDRTPSPAPAPAAGSAARAPSIAMLDLAAAWGAASPNLAASGHRPLLTWLEPSGADPRVHRLRVAELVDGRWMPPRTIAEGAAIIANWADVPSIIRQDPRTLVASWTEHAEGGAEASDAIIARSTDDGQTWQRLGPVHRDRTATEHAFVSLVPDGDAVLAVWLDGRALTRTGGATSLRGARIGPAIGDEQLLDDRVCDCCSTSAAATSDGPVIAYRDRSDDELRDAAVARRIDATWQPPRTVHADRWQITGCPVNGPASAALGRDLVVGWYSHAGQRPTVQLAFSADAGAAFATPLLVDEPRGARAPLGRVDAALIHGGEAIVSWVAIERDRAHVLIRRIARDGRRGAELAVATLAAGPGGGVPRIERVDDALLLAWTDAASKTVRTARIALADIPPLAAR